jgi:SDR family mycofactocin-dependent oxidoreductase
MGRVQGKVAFVTGAGRGQGRAHAVRLAEEGADIIAVDICKDFEGVGYEMSSPEDLDETRNLVEKTGQRAVTAVADVADASKLASVLKDGVDTLGKLDIVVATAGIMGVNGKPAIQTWTDTINTNLIGTINAIQVALPYLSAGASIIATGSTAAMMDLSKKDNPGADMGGQAYAVSKRLLSQYVHDLATELAAQSIRANVVHPTNCNTRMLQSDPMYKVFRPDLERPTREDAELVFPVQQAMPVPYIEPEDMSNAVLWLASDEARYVTGVQLRVDAGSYLKWYDYHI